MNPDKYGSYDDYESLPFMKKGEDISPMVPIDPNYAIESEMEKVKYLLDPELKEVITKDLAISNLNYSEIYYLRRLINMVLVYREFADNCPKRYKKGFKDLKKFFQEDVISILKLAGSRGGFERELIATKIRRENISQSFIDKGKKII